MDQGILSLLAIGYYINPRSLEAFEIQMLVQVTRRNGKGRLKNKMLQPTREHMDTTAGYP